MFADGQESGAWRNIPCLPGSIKLYSGQGMENVYLGVGAALYLAFVAWCIISPHK